jgi:V8-like Glu-specific endopeptidase
MARAEQMGVHMVVEAPVLSAAGRMAGLGAFGPSSSSPSAVRNASMNDLAMARSKVAMAGRKTTVMMSRPVAPMSDASGRVGITGKNPIPASAKGFAMRVPKGPVAQDRERWASGTQDRITAAAKGLSLANMDWGDHRAAPPKPQPKRTWIGKQGDATECPDNCTEACADLAVAPHSAVNKTAAPLRELQKETVPSDVCPPIKSSIGSLEAMLRSDARMLETSPPELIRARVSQLAIRSMGHRATGVSGYGSHDCECRPACAETGSHCKCAGANKSNPDSDCRCGGASNLRNENAQTDRSALVALDGAWRRSKTDLSSARLEAADVNYEEMESNHSQLDMVASKPGTTALPSTGPTHTSIAHVARQGFDLPQNVVRPARLFTTIKKETEQSTPVPPGSSCYGGCELCFAGDPPRNEERFRIFNTIAPPYRSVVDLWMTFSDAVNHCSGTLVGPRHVLTAGHCVFGPIDPGPEGGGLGAKTRRREWAKSVTAIVARNETFLPFGVATGVPVWAEHSWLEDFDFHGDYALIQLDRQIGEGPEELKVVSAVSGELLDAATVQRRIQPLTDDQLSHEEAKIVGYPCDARAGVMMGSIGWVTDHDEFRVEYDARTAEGNSGSPIFSLVSSRNVVYGVHSSCADYWKPRLNDLTHSVTTARGPRITPGRLWELATIVNPACCVARPGALLQFDNAGGTSRTYYPTAVTASSGRQFDAFWIDKDTGEVFSRGMPLSASLFDPIMSLGKPTASIIGGVAAVVAGTRLKIFVTGSDGYLYLKQKRGDSPWGADWIQIGKPVLENGTTTPSLGTPTVVHRSGTDEEVSIFVVCKDQSIAHGVSGRSHTPGYTIVHKASWENIGGRTFFQPAAVSPSPNRLQVYIRADDGTILFKKFDAGQWWTLQFGESVPSQSGWTSLGARAPSQSAMDRPVAIDWAPGRVDVFSNDFSTCPRTSGTPAFRTYVDWSTLLKLPPGTPHEGFIQWTALWPDAKAIAPLAVVPRPFVNEYSIFRVDEDLAVRRLKWNLLDHPSFQLKTISAPSTDPTAFAPLVIRDQPPLPIWEKLGGSMYDIAAVEGSPGRITLVGRGSDNSIRVRSIFA